MKSGSIVLPDPAEPVPARSRSHNPLGVLHSRLVLTTALVAAIVAATFWLSARNQSDDEWVHHTLAVREQLVQVLILVQRAESAQRGYLLTGDEIYLEPYDSCAASCNARSNRGARQRQSAARRRCCGFELIDGKIGDARHRGDRKAGRAAAALAIVSRPGSPGLRQVSRRDGGGGEPAARQAGGRGNIRTLLRWGWARFLLVCVLGALIGYFTRRSFAEVTAARDRLVVANAERLEQVQAREQAESQLRQSQKMEAIGQLSGGIAHDFNNMLGVITGALDLMQRRIRNGDLGIERLLEAATQASERAAGLTHRLLAFARQQPLAPEPINADGLIASMSDLLRSTLGEHLQIETVAAAGLWFTHADAISSKAQFSISPSMRATRCRAAAS